MAVMPRAVAPRPADEAGRPVRPAWYNHRLNRPVVYRAAAMLGAGLPRAGRLRLAAALAPRLRGLFRTEWAVVLRNAARIAPEASAPAREALAADVFRHFAMCFSDLMVTNRRAHTAGLLAGIEGRSRFEDLMRSGRGVVVLTAHLGNWELGGRLMAHAGDRVTHVVVEAEVDPRLEALLRGGPSPVRFVARRRPTDAVGLLAALRRGEVVAMQGDRAIGTRGDTPVSFFGAPARFPLGPFVLARAARVVVLPAFCVLERDRRYTVHVGEPIDVPAGAEDAAQARWVAALEAMVRLHPEQWFNFFDCWSACPEA
jgi:KDO2-lipid IV(A) lauroyltransferase